jgi:hypothetical protein
MRTRVQRRKSSCTPMPTMPSPTSWKPGRRIARTVASISCAASCSPRSGYALARNGKTLPCPIRELRPRALPESDDDPAGVDQLTRLALLRDNLLFGHRSEDQLAQVAPLTRCLRFATVRAHQECVLLAVERDHLRLLLEGNPQLVERLARLISERRAHLSNLNQERTEAGAISQCSRCARWSRSSRPREAIGLLLRRAAP